MNILKKYLINQILKMKMIEIMNPPFEPSTHIDTRKIGDEFDAKFR